MCANAGPIKFSARESGSCEINSSMLRETVENILQTRMKDDMLAWALENPECFPILIELALSGHPSLGWRAAWVLYDAMEYNDPRVRPSLPGILDFLPFRKDGHQRELLKICAKMDIDDHLAGRLFEFAVSIWENTRKAPALRYYAFVEILRIAKRFPELNGEVRALAAFPYLQSLTPGVRRAIEKMLAKV